LITYVVTGIQNTNATIEVKSVVANSNVGPRIKAAFLGTGANTHSNTMYHDLQKQYFQARSISPVDLNPSSARELMQYRNRLDSYASTFNCGPGAIPRFIGYNGQDVPIKQALVTKNGRQFINTSVVDPDRSYCTAVIPLERGMQMNAMFGNMKAMYLPQWRQDKNMDTMAIPFDASADIMPRNRTKAKKNNHKLLHVVPAEEEDARAAEAKYRRRRRRRGGGKVAKKKKSVSKNRKSKRRNADTNDLRRPDC